MMICADFLIIAKIPFLDLKNEFIAQKMKRNYKWYNSQAALQIIQGVGRGVRSENDWCVSFILDGCFDNLTRCTGDMFTDKFLDRIVRINENVLIK